MEKGKQAVLKAVRGYLDAYAVKDLAGCMALTAEKSPVLMFGTNDDEIFKGRTGVQKAYRKDFSMIDKIKFGEYRNLHVESDGQLASVIFESPISWESDGKKTRTILRWALTLIIEDKKWKVCAGLASIPFKSGTYSY